MENSSCDYNLARQALTADFSEMYKMYLLIKTPAADLGFWEDLTKLVKARPGRRIIPEPSIFMSKQNGVLKTSVERGSEGYV